MPVTSAQRRLSALVVVCCACAWADGPHWQAPNPDGDPYTDDEDAAKDAAEKREAERKKTEEAKKKKPGQVVLPPGFTRFGGWGHQDYDVNPGDLLALDKACIQYYERHCAISYESGALRRFVARTGPGGVRQLQPAKPAPNLSEKEKKKRFYLLIMERCAQAMREVDTYLPCPDSYPLWHEEDLRAKMLEYAQRTWVRSVQLPPEFAQACAEFCARAFVDSVRFDDDVKSRRLGGWLANLVALNQQLTQLLQKMDSEEDTQKQMLLRRQWSQLAAQAMGLIAQNGGLGPTYKTFSLVTGDIPLCLDDAAQRMRCALVEMGPSVIPHLQRAAGLTNTKVRQIVQVVVDHIGKRWNLNAEGANLNPTAGNVLEHLRWIKTKPGSHEAKVSERALQEMGTPGLVRLISIAENEFIGERETALAVLRGLLGQPATATLDELRKAVAERRNPPPEAGLTISRRPGQEPDKTTPKRIEKVEEE
jgi:hypothetical protein